MTIKFGLFWNSIAVASLVVGMQQSSLAANSCTYESKTYTDGSFHDPSAPTSSQKSRQSQGSTVPMRQQSQPSACSFNSLSFSDNAFHQNGSQCQKCAGDGSWINIDNSFCTHHQQCSDGVWLDKEP
jgi:hypothetical protein